MGYTMHLRATDGTAQGSHALRRFMEIVNGSRAAPQQPPQPQVQAQPTGEIALPLFLGFPMMGWRESLVLLQL